MYHTLACQLPVTGQSLTISSALYKPVTHSFWLDRFLQQLHYCRRSSNDPGDPSPIHTRRQHGAEQSNIASVYRKHSIIQQLFPCVIILALNSLTSPCLNALACAGRARSKGESGRKRRNLCSPSEQEDGCAYCCVSLSFARATR